MTLDSLYTDAQHIVDGQRELALEKLHKKAQDARARWTEEWSTLREFVNAQLPPPLWDYVAFPYMCDEEGLVQAANSSDPVVFLSLPDKYFRIRVHVRLDQRVKPVWQHVGYRFTLTDPTHRPVDKESHKEFVEDPRWSFFVPRGPGNNTEEMRFMEVAIALVVARELDREMPTLDPLSPEQMPNPGPTPDPSSLDAFCIAPAQTAMPIPDPLTPEQMLASLPDPDPLPLPDIDPPPGEFNWPPLMPDQPVEGAEND